MQRQHEPCHTSLHAEHAASANLLGLVLPVERKEKCTFNALTPHMRSPIHGQSDSHNCATYTNRFTLWSSEVDVSPALVLNTNASFCRLEDDLPRRSNANITIFRYVNRRSVVEGKEVGRRIKQHRQLLQCSLPTVEYLLQFEGAHSYGKVQSDLRLLHADAKLLRVRSPSQAIVLTERRQGCSKDTAGEEEPPHDYLMARPLPPTHYGH